MVANIDALNKIHDRVKELNRQNNQLRQKYLAMPNTPEFTSACRNAVIFLKTSARF